MQSLVCATLMVATVLAVVMPSVAAAGELKWRSGRSALKPSQPALARHRLDSAVHPAAFEDDAVQLAGAEGRAQFRSVIIPHDEPSDVLRSAQLPETPQPTDELPPLETPQPDDFDLDMPPQPEGTLQLEPDQPPLRDSDVEPQLIPRPESLDILPGQPLPEDFPEPSAGTMQAERKKAEQACEQGLVDLQAKTVNTLNLAIAVTGEEGSDYPFECSLADAGWHEGRSWEQTVYMWKASALCHKPLFFEDEHLERYGHSWSPCCQPLISSAHFFTRLPILPYCMGVEPPNECIYALGHYRPGSCAPYMCNPVPLSCRGALFQAGAVVGAAALLP